jgi:hypothetical protein
MFDKTKTNLWLDTLLFILFVITVLTGLSLWLFLPEGRGSGELSVLSLAHRTLKTVHEGTGVSILVVVCVHLALHWRWLLCIIKRRWGRLPGQTRVNFTLDSLLLTIFIWVNLSGLLIWLVLFGGGYRGGRNPLHNAVSFGFTRHDGIDFHRWAALILIIVIGVHLTLHWRWIVRSLQNHLCLIQPHLSSPGH